jgi:putative aminopeptidase FrvX
MEEFQGEELLRRLTLLAGPPGAEGPVRSFFRRALDGVGRIECDRLGSIACEKRGASASPRIELDGHLDEVGFMVQTISDEGALGFIALGGWWEHVLLGQRVDVLAERGPVPGVVASKPVHFLSAEERKHVLPIDKLHIDIGASSREEAAEMGVRIGDPVVPHAEFFPFANPKVLSSKAFDDRVGVALVIEALRGLDGGHPNTVVGVGAVQEEVGSRGAATSARIAEPDAAIVLEGTPADDLPGTPQAQRQAVLGKGPQLRFYDPTALSNRAFARFVEDVARAEGIPLQIAVRRSGGTDARAIAVHGRGVPTVVIGVPARYIHTHVSLIHLDDYVAARRLAIALVNALDGAAVESFTAF